MRRARERFGVLRRASALVTRNWGLKLLALVLALVIYHTLKTGNETSDPSHDRHFIQRP